MVELVVGNNITFNWKAVLLRRRISDDRMKEHTDIINGKYEGNDFETNSIGQTSIIFSISYNNKNSGKGYIRTDIKFSEKMMMTMIETPDIIK